MKLSSLGLWIVLWLTTHVMAAPMSINENGTIYFEDPSPLSKRSKYTHPLQLNDLSMNLDCIGTV